MDSFVDLNDNDGSQALDLSRIRYQLMYAHKLLFSSFLGLPCFSRLEDTIIFALIERVQFALNKVCLLCHHLCIYMYIFLDVYFHATIP